jgi:hypothetical protein
MYFSHDPDHFILDFSCRSHKIIVHKYKTVGFPFLSFQPATLQMHVPQ